MPISKYFARISRNALMICACSRIIVPFFAPLERLKNMPLLPTAKNKWNLPRKIPAFPKSRSSKFMENCHFLLRMWFHNWAVPLSILSSFLMFPPLAFGIPPRNPVLSRDNGFRSSAKRLACFWGWRKQWFPNFCTFQVLKLWSPFRYAWQSLLGRSSLPFPPAVIHEFCTFHPLSLSALFLEKFGNHCLP